MAVSKPNFARKYALESSRRDLHNGGLEGGSVLAEGTRGVLGKDRSRSPPFVDSSSISLAFAKESFDFGEKVRKCCRLRELPLNEMK